MIGLLALWTGGASAETGPALGEGRYVLELHSASRARVPVVGWTPSVTVSVVLVDLVRTANGWEQRQEVCDVRMESHKRRGETTIPDAFVASLPPKRYAVELTSSEDGLSYVADLGIDTLGYDPTVAKELPRKPGDAGVLDTDGDGKPGVTVRVSVPLIGGADIYVVQRASMRLVGEVVADGMVKGRIEVDTFEQRTLAATNFMFKGSPDIEPVPEESWFVMRRAPGATCENVTG